MRIWCHSTNIAHSISVLVSRLNKQFNCRDFAVVRLNSNSGTTLDITFNSKLTNLKSIITRTLAINAASGIGSISNEYTQDNYPTA